MVIMNTRNTKLMYAVEYESVNGGQTFDIFGKRAEALKCFEQISQYGGEYKPLYIFRALFNKELIYKEKTGQWNYEDLSGLICSGGEIVKKPLR